MEIKRGKKMKKFTNSAAQGDLLLIRVEKLPEGLSKMKSEGGNFIVAHSETGHHHVIAERENVIVYGTENPLVSYLEVIEATDKAEAVIEHLRSFDTHESISISAGIYEIRRQREYFPEGWRRVQD